MGTGHALDVVVGEQLSSVEFVQDYLQLHFDGPTLTIYRYPLVEVGGVRHAGGSPGYRDLLCDRIAKQVCSVTVTAGKEIGVEFEDGARIAIPLRPCEGSGPEAAMFQDPGVGAWEVWQYGMP